MVWILVVAYVASAALPIWGAINLYKIAKRENEEFAKSNHGRTDVMTYGGLQAAINGSLIAIRSKPGEVRKDALMVAAGVVIGAAASIASLFV